MDGEVWNSAFIYYREIIQPFTMRANIPNFPIHATIGISKTKAGLYKQGKTDLFAALICLKYLLDAKDFACTCTNISSALACLCNETKQIPPNKILSCMGFPMNWIDILN